MPGSTMHNARPILIVCALVISVALIPPPARAQVEPITRYPMTPPAADCTIEPRTADSIVDLFANATPIAADAPATSATIPLGREAQDSVAVEITRTIEMAFACQNAGDFARFFALLTDHAIVTIFPWLAEMVVDEEMAADMIAVNPPGEESLQTILGIGGITSVGQGRYTAVVVYLDPNGGDEAFALHLTFIGVNGVWLVDDVIDFHIAD